MPTERPATQQSRPFRFPSRICVPVAAQTAEQLEAAVVALQPRYPFQELRLDYLAHPHSAMTVVGSLTQAFPDALFLATCRPVRSGGRLNGSAQDELEGLSAAAAAGSRIVDLSIESAEELGPEALARLRAQGSAVLLSFHDFQGTGDLQAVLARMRPFAPDFFKVVSTAHSLEDSLASLHLLGPGKWHSGKTIAIAMDEPGVLTRVLAPRFDAPFTFGAATEAEATAPGQLTADTLASLYRLEQMTPDTRIFGVAGDPIRSSLSPLMHNTAFGKASLDAVYLPLKTADARELFRLAGELSFEGLSITMPLKQAVMPLLDHVDALAARIGAVNTVHRSADGRLLGYNTDAAGIVVPLERRIPLRGARVLILGAGGAARAAVFGCVERGAEVSIYNRTHASAQELAHEAGAKAIERSALATETFDVLLNSTPAGMRGNALALPIEEHELRAKLVFDLVYNPLETPLVKLARAKGCEVIPGVEMFVHQGACQFEIWTGQPAPVEAMQDAVLGALSGR